MLSKSEIGFIKSLQQKKFRKEQALFVVEGLKSVLEFLQSGYRIHSVYGTSTILPKLGKISQNIKLLEVKADEIAKISGLNTPQDVLAVVYIPQKDEKELIIEANTFHLLLDGVQDPGNLGTIIRTADWFGFKELICSIDTVEAYNPKVVQASMGSLARIKVIYTDLEDVIRRSSLPTFAATLGGTSIFETKFGTEGLLILGNEGNGIRPEILEKVSNQVTIPLFGAAESLNVAVSAGIFCAEVRRKA
ncbi:MAG: RNA methyltransferase [Sphingobacteriales bacterium]|nr:RNA methyltransferase [Sphingobacteriales bacterium]